jgi:hypothetical protein
LDSFEFESLVCLTEAKPAEVSFISSVVKPGVDLDEDEDEDVEEDVENEVEKDVETDVDDEEDTEAVTDDLDAADGWADEDVGGEGWGTEGSMFSAEGVEIIEDEDGDDVVIVMDVIDGADSE